MSINDSVGCRCALRAKPSYSRCCCIAIGDVPVERPDLAIYSQDEQFSLGMTPSWNSPDIVTNNWGPFRLMPEAIVVVRNLSATVPAANVLVHYYTSPFGIGTRRTLKQSRQLAIAAGQQVTLLFPLDQATLGGDPRVGVHIAIEHPSDAKPINNVGSQVHNGATTTESGRTFTVPIPVFNDSPVNRQIVFSILPTDMLGSLSVLSQTFQPYQQMLVDLQVTVPPSIVGSANNVKESEVTVVGRLNDGTLIGGITHLLRIDS